MVANTAELMVQGQETQVIITDNTNLVIESQKSLHSDLIALLKAGKVFSCLYLHILLHSFID